MSLLRLLAAGRSLVGLNQPNSRYRVTSQRLLPRFVSKGNPFRTQADGAEKSRLTSAEPPEAAPPAATSQVLPAASIHACKQIEIAPVKPKSAAKPASQKWADWASKCAATVAGAIHARPAKPAKPAIPAFAKPLVQGELSLERVKVVRNDLSDSDLDIVRCRPEPTSANRPSAVKEPSKPEPVGSQSGRVTIGRLFGAGKT